MRSTGDEEHSCNGRHQSQSQHLRADFRPGGREQQLQGSNSSRSPLFLLCVTWDHIPAPHVNPSAGYTGALVSVSMSKGRPQSCIVAYPLRADVAGGQVEPGARVLMTPDPKNILPALQRGQNGCQ
ncbi:unnamed protein product [Arctogadus glacialis]